jgi:hypothetical protein
VHRFLRLGFHLSGKDKLFVRNYPYLFLNSYYICGEIGEIRNNQVLYHDNALDYEVQLEIQKNTIQKMTIKAW